MNHSDNSRTISLVCELRVFRVFVPPNGGPLGSQSELTLIQASAFRSTQQLNGCYDKRLQLPVQQLLTWLWRLTSRWHDAWSPLDCSNEIAVQANEYFGCRSFECHQHISSGSCQCQYGQMLRGNITVVDIIIVPFVHDIIKFRFCICSKLVSQNCYYRLSNILSSKFRIVV